jgi:hypothetical protein
MTTGVQDLLRSCELLPEADKRELAAQILRRSLRFESPPLSDEDLVRNAEALFLDLDRREEEDGKGEAG